MYIYDLATTGTISFSDFLITTDLISQVSATTQLRARLRAVLKSNRAGTSSTSASTKDASGSKSLDIGQDGSKGDGDASDWLLIVKTLEEYIPHLLAVYNCVQTDDLILRYEPIFSWRTTISSSRFRGPQRVDLPGLHYELASTLLTYALTLSNFASATVTALGSYERNRTISSENRKAKDDRLRWAADTLCRASGILLYLSQDFLPKWRDQVGRVDGLPLDLTTEATLALSKVCLAEAQALAIRKLLSPSVGKAVDTVTPGPPLEKGHPSASLLAKLHLNVVEELESAVGLLRTVEEKRKAGGKGRGGKSGGGGGGERVGLSANHEHELSRRISATNDNMRDGEDDAGSPAGEGSGKGKKLFGKLRFGKDKDGGKGASGPHDVMPNLGGVAGSSFYTAPSSSSSSSGLDKDLDITSSFLKYLSFSATFHRSMAYKWLAIDAGESSPSRIGQAITFLSLSSSLLSSTSLKDLSSTLSNISISSSSLLPSSTSTKLFSSKTIVDQELSTVNHWLTSYRKLNDTVSFQPVPPAAEVTAKVPAGRAALLVKEFRLPEPSFGPGSQGYKGRGGEGSGFGLAKEEVHLLDEDHPARRNLVGMSGASAGEEGGLGGQSSAAGGKGYAGQGAYY